MSDGTVSRLRLAVADTEVVERYWSHVKTGRPDECWLWTGAISGKGHGRFQIADERITRPDGMTTRRTYVVIAHRFGYAALHGVDALLDIPLLAHQCDNPICQNPRCWRESNHRANGREYAYRRDVVRGALTDTRGARGRARAVRDAARAGSPISEAVLAGLRPVHLDQIELFTDAANSSPGTTGPSSSTPQGRDEANARSPCQCDRRVETDVQRCRRGVAGALRGRHVPAFRRSRPKRW